MSDMQTDLILIGLAVATLAVEIWWALSGGFA